MQEIPQENPGLAAQNPLNVSPAAKPSVKGKKLKRKIFLGTVLFILLVIYFVNMAINNRKEVDQVNPDFVKETTQTTKSEKPIEPDKKWAVLELQEYGLKISYLQDLYIERNNPFSKNPPTFSMLYRGLRQPEGLINEANLEDGYIFKIVIYANPATTDIREVAKKKLDNYVFNCPEIAKISGITSTKVDTLPAVKFSVENCTSNFEETYVFSSNFIYEFVQVYKGDLGYKQKYAKDTEEMLLSVKIDREAPVPPSQFTVFNIDNPGIMFTHPKLNTSCCKVPRPSKTPYSLEWYFADVTGDVPAKGKPFDGFGLFVYRLPSAETFESYLTAQEEYLKEDYRLSTGQYADNPQIQDIKVGNAQGKVLKNYAWWGDIIYVPFNAGKNIAIISKTEYLPGSFKELFEGILDTFEFKVL